MSINRVILAGVISHGGCQLRYTPNAKPQASLTVVLEELGFGERSGTSYKTFVPVKVVGPQAETAAQDLEPGDTVLLEGKLSFESGKTKEANRLIVTTFSIERLLAAAVESAN
jgi:single-stranded DNA-binding protein